MAFRRALPILVLFVVLLPLFTVTEASRELGEKSAVGESKWWVYPKFCYKPTNFENACVECRYYCDQKFYWWGFCYPRCCHCPSSKRWKKNP